MLDDGAVGDVLVGWLRGLVRVGGGRGLFDEALEEVVLRGGSAPMPAYDS